MSHKCELADLGRDCLFVNAEGCHVTSDGNEQFTFSDGAIYCAQQLGHMANLKDSTVGTRACTCTCVYTSFEQSYFAPVCCELETQLCL